MSAKRLATFYVAVILAGLGAPGTASAARPVLPNTWGSTHFVIHYAQTVVPVSTAQATAAAAEEGYAHLVTGAGGAPNAGLRPPINDGDGRTDIYLTTWDAYPDYSGGVTLDDTTAPYAAWFILTPDLSLSSLRFRAVHEFMHVLQQAYQPFPSAPIAGMWTERTANWAVSWSLPEPEMTPMDSNFYDSPMAPAPWLPLDCSYGTWPTVSGRPCGNGYWQWLFMERQVEDYGVDFVDGLLERVKACVSSCATSTSDQTFLNAEIAAQAGSGASLATKFGRYAWQVWDPAVWTNPALGRMHERIGRPPAWRWDRSNLGPGESGGSYVIDHLGTRYVLVQNFGDPAPGGPNDVLSYRVTRPAAGQLPSWVYLTRAKGGTSWSFHNVTAATGTIPFDGALTREVVIPLTNTGTSDGQSFSIGLWMNRGTPAAPANDVQAGAIAATLDAPVQTDTVYAGGRGSLETTGCTATDMSAVLNGVWFRFTAPNTGQYTFDATTSTLDPVIVLTDRGSTTFRGCSTLNGRYSVPLTAGDQRDVYVGRQASDTGDATLARLVISGPPSNTAAPVISGTARDAQQLTRASDGTWTGSPTSFTRQWRRCDLAGANCAAIAGATGTTFTLTPADVGKTIRLQVSASNTSGTGTGVSLPTTVVAARPPVNTVVPAITGTTQEGKTLSVTNGTWTGTPVIAYSRRWERCTGGTCAAIPGAVASTYTAIADDAGHPLRVTVTATNAAGSADATSAITAPVSAAPAPTPPGNEPFSGTTAPIVGPEPLTLPPTQPARTVTLQTRRLSLDRRGRIALRVRCSSADGAACRIAASLKTARKVRVGARRRVLTLATKSVTVAAGPTRTVTLKPGPTARRVVRKARTVRATLVLGVRQADGSTRAVTAAVTLRAS
ncbi:MAG: hypothetical protein JHC95_01710 [Solirubrobacteraceae bacterium]|nr:hypothetical protein [Solirubrobacteraceae bacterium]